MPRPKAITILICFALFVFFVFMTFPFQNLRGYIFGKIYQNTRILIVAEDLYPTIFGWPGIGIRNVNVTLPIGNGEMDLASEKLIFRVGPGGIFPPVPAIIMSMKGLKKGGDLYLKFSQTRTHMSGTVQADDVEMKQLAFSGLSEPIPGKLNIDTDFVVDSTDISKSTGSAKLDVSKLKVPAQNIQGFLLPALAVGDIKGKITMKNGIAEITSFTFGSKDADLKGSISGDMRLGQNMLSSFLNLTVKIQLSEAYRNNPQAATFVSLLESYKTSATEYGMKWSATLQDMTTNIVAAIPQKLAAQ